jgi:acyl-CoA-dependent ceramide synthase
MNIRLWPDIVFGLFMVIWFFARHVLYLTVCYSVWAHIPEEISYGCYQGREGNLIGPFPPTDNFKHLIAPFRNPEGIICWNNKIKWGFLTALLSLQCITILWFWMILNVAAKVLRGGEAEDIRSDDEDEREYTEPEETTYQKLEPIEVVPLEEEVGVEGISLKGRTSSSKRYKKPSSSSSGVTLPGHSDRKELLGRIGCDKGV